MGWKDWLLPSKGDVVDVQEEQYDATLREVLEKYDLVDVVTPPEGNSFVIVSERETAPTQELIQRPVPGAATTMQGKQFRDSTSSVDLTELGTSSPSPFVSFSRQEYNRDLAGLKGLEMYDRMRKSDGVVRGTLRVFKTPVLAGRWFIEAGGDAKADKNAADFVWKCLTEYMSISWPQLLQESLLQAEFGYYMFEKVWEERVVDGKDRIVWSKLAPRHPMDVINWKYDANGGPLEVVMYPPTANPMDDNIVIPIDKLLVFTHDREAGNIQGISVLRAAYKHWYFKEQLYKIDAIQKERHGIGIPVIKLPAGFTVTDKTLANEMGRNLRTNERAHVVLPPNWDLIFAKMEGRHVDALASVKQHDEAIRENVLAGFLGSGVTTKEEDQEMFLKATRFMADSVCETFNLYAIPQLVDKNFDRVKYPKLRVRRIGEQADWRTLSFAIRNLVGAGIVVPDDPLEERMRDEMDLPKADPATSRQTAAPQMPGQPGAPAAPGGDGHPDNVPGGKNAQIGKNAPQPAAGKKKQNTNKNQVGLPRQSPTPPVGSGTRGAGKDQSGGK
jgi:hypothetical protein